MIERSTIDVALELARSGRFRTMVDLKKALEKEGCDQVNAHLSGAGFKAQLLRIMTEAQR